MKEKGVCGEGGGWKPPRGQLSWRWRPLRVSVRTEGGETSFPSHPGKHRAPEPTLAPAGVLPLTSLVAPAESSGPSRLPHPLLLRPRRVHVSPAHPKNTWGYSVAPWEPHCSIPTTDPPLACPLGSPASSPWGGFSVVVFNFSQFSQWALLEPWKLHQFSQHLSKTRHVSPLHSQAIQVWNCLPAL